MIRVSTYGKLPILSSSETTEVIEGGENIFRRAVAAATTIKQQLDGCFDHTDPAGLVTIEDRWNTINDLAKRGVRMQYLTDIREDNIQYCEKMMSRNRTTTSGGSQGQLWNSR